VKKLDLEERVYKTCMRESYITLKEHKENVHTNPKTRLINTTKTEVGEISKQILSKKVAEIRRKSKLVQWKNSYSVVDWFKRLENKEKSHFLVFDIVNYYPSINQELLQKSINWAKNFVDFSEDEVETIMETKKSFLVMKGQHWTKKREENFDVAQGSFDSAECSDIVGLFLLSELEKENLNANLGLFRDDGLGVTRGTQKQNQKNQKKPYAKYSENMV